MKSLSFSMSGIIPPRERYDEFTEAILDCIHPVWGVNRVFDAWHKRSFDHVMSGLPTQTLAIPEGRTG
jgi:hypothetical protein